MQAAHRKAHAISFVGSNGFCCTSQTQKKEDQNGSSTVFISFPFIIQLSISLHHILCDVTSPFPQHHCCTHRLWSMTHHCCTHRLWPMTHHCCTHRLWSMTLASPWAAMLTWPAWGESLSGVSVWTMHGHWTYCYPRLASSKPSLEKPMPKAGTVKTLRSQKPDCCLRLASLKLW
jgi:hypothetical protein